MALLGSIMEKMTLIFHRYIFTISTPQKGESFLWWVADDGFRVLV